MRKTALLLTTVLLLALTACDRFHTSDNGVLDGFWQLTNVDSLHNGKSVDVKQLKVFWAVQANLLEVRDITMAHPDIIFRFERGNGTLTLSQPLANNRPISDSIVTDPATLRFYGISNLTETLRVLVLNEDKMTLESQMLRMYFRKY